MTQHAALDHAQFLEGLSAVARIPIDALARPHSFAPGDVLFQEGTVHDDLHVVQSGHVRLEMIVPDRGRVAILTVGPGELLGWSPLFGDHPMTATAIAMDAVQTLAFDGQDLRRACESNHEVGYEVMRQIVRLLSQRLVATRLQLLDLFHAPSPTPSLVPQTRTVDPEC